MKANVIAALMTTTAATVMLLPAPALAQQASAEARSFDIPAQSLPDALVLFGRQAGLEVSAESANTRGRTTQGVSGSLAPGDALSRLLAGTGLTYRWISDRAVMVEPGAAAAASDGSSITLGAVRVEGEGQGRGTGTVRPPADTRGTYTVPATSSATRLDLAIKDTPQVVNVITRQRIEDQNLVQVADVMAQQPGVTVTQQGVPGMGRIEYWSRGFPVTMVMFDGVLTQGAGNDNFTLWSLIDTATFDRVEFVQGSTGLSSGLGNPSGAVNFIRKRPTEEFQAEGTLSYGSWERLRGTVDVAGPLAAGGRVRGRFVGAYNQGGNWQDRVEYKMGTAYGIVEADVTDDLMLTAGVSWTKTRVDDAAIFGMRTAAYTLSNRTGYVLTADLGRHYNPATQWSYADVELLNPFAKAEWRFANNWRLDASYMFSDVTQDRVTGTMGQLVYDVAQDRASYEWGRLQQTGQIHNADLMVSGKFQALGREHDLMFGASFYSGHVLDGVFSSSISGSRIGYDRLIISEWNNGDIPFPSNGGEEMLPGVPNFLTYDPLHRGLRYYGLPDDATSEKQYSAYIGARLRPIDRVQLILGGRWNYWDRKKDAWTLNLPHLFGCESNTDTVCAGPVGEFLFEPDVANNWHVKVRGKFTPYAGLVFDVAKDVTAYASYTGISRANAGFGGSMDFTGGWARDEDGNPLPPITGNSWEIGAKAGLFNNRLNVQLTGFRMEQKNLPAYYLYSDSCVQDGITGRCMAPAVPGGGIVSQGIEFNVAGQITSRINIAASYSYLDLELDQIYDARTSRDQDLILEEGQSAYCENVDTDYASLNGKRAFHCPKHTIKVFGTWQVTNRLTLGGGGIWKSATAVQGVPAARRSTDEELAAVIDSMSQDSFVVVDLMARYRLSDNFSISANVNNVFDKTYFTSNDEYGSFYGAPRNVMITISGKF